MTEPFEPRSSGPGTSVHSVLDAPAPTGSRTSARTGIDEGVVPGMLRRRARMAPQHPAVLAPSAQEMTYAGLVRQVETVSRTLAAMGVGRGDRVAVVLRNGPEMLVCFLAVSSVAVCAPLNPAYRAAEFDFYLRDVQPKALVLEHGAGSPVREVAAQHGIPVVELHFRPNREAGAFRLDSKEGPLPEPSPDDPALVLHTSGTTSRPKMVALSQRNLLCSAGAIAESLELVAADRCLNVMPLFHIHGLVGAALSTLSAGGGLVCSPGFQAMDFLDWLDAFRPSWYTAVPTMHQAVLARAEQLGRPKGPGSLRFVRSCSSALPPRVQADLEAQFGVPVIEAYGMTEAAHQVASNPLPPGVRKPGSVGVGTGTEVRVVDPQGRSLPPGEVGEIVIRGPGVMRGYVSPPGANTDAFVGDGWFRTGDQGRLDAQDYLFIEGRTKEIINRAGEKISPRQVDEALLEHPAVAEALAFALPDARLGEDVAAAVVLQPGAAATETELRAFVGARLAEFKVPRRIVFLDTMPKGATGKPQRIGLAEKLGLKVEAPAARERRAEPRSPLERQLAAIWMDVLRLDQVGIYDDFFGLGGDSLAALQASQQITSIGRREITVTDLVNAPTIAEVSALLSAWGGQRSHQYIGRVQPFGSRPPVFCIGGGPLHRDLARCLGPDQPFLAVTYPNASALSKPYRLQEIAAFHVSTIRVERPNGPYVIAGWCMDGLVAYEVAQQLRQAGEEVDLLVLFDALNDPARTRRSGAQAGARLRSVARKLGFHLAAMRGLKPSEAAGYLAGRIDTVLGRARRTATQVMVRTGVTAQSPDVVAIMHEAAGRYHPAPYEGRTLLLARELRPAGEDPDGRLGWSELVPDLALQRVPGDHRDMFLEPHVQVTAEAICRCLGTA